MHSSPVPQKAEPKQCQKSRSAGSSLARVDQARCSDRVRAALRAAALSSSGPLVSTAFSAASCRASGPRFFAAARACLERLICEAADLGSFLRNPKIACARLPEDSLLLACVDFLAFFCPGFGGSFTPARLASESPIAMACFADFAPCFPLRICSISSRTNSPAWVVGAFPSFLSFFARSIALFSGIKGLPFEQTKGFGPRHDLFSIQSACQARSCHESSDELRSVSELLDSERTKARGRRSANKCVNFWV